MAKPFFFVRSLLIVPSKNPIQRFSPMNIVTLRSKLATISIRQGRETSSRRRLGVRLQVSFGDDETTRICLWQIVSSDA